MFTVTHNSHMWLQRRRKEICQCTSPPRTGCLANNQLVSVSCKHLHQQNWHKLSLIRNSAHFITQILLKLLKITIKNQLSCEVWLDSVFEVTYPCFPTTWILCKRSMFSWILCKRSKLLVKWLFGINDIVTLHSCLDVTYLLWHHNGCMFTVMSLSSDLVEHFTCCDEATTTFTTKK